MRKDIIVIEKPEVLPLKNFPNVEVVSAKKYLTDQSFAVNKNFRVFNLCRSYRYQSQGYYVSLLAEARGHRVIPGVMAIQDFKSQQIVRILSEDINDLIQKKLKNIKSQNFVLSLFFGQNMAEHYEDLGRKFFSLVKAPMMRVEFEKSSEGWLVNSVRPISFSEVDPKHYEFIEIAAINYFSKRDTDRKNIKNYHYDIAILVNPNEEAPPSDKKALDQFMKAAKKLDMRPELITKDDSSRILEFDALFIRETTNVHHHTYRMARKAEAEGLVVIDDPSSILKCTNKVFLEEILSRHQIPRPSTIIIHKDNYEEVAKKAEYPCILKKPDSAFSQGVYKAESYEKFIALSEELLTKSELVIVQEFLPSDFDWRIGVLDGKALYACKYYMAKGHWQIVNNHAEGGAEDGAFETLPIEMVPKKVLSVALKSAKLMGDGLYGIDLKQKGDQVYMIEVNDNPSIDFGVEDAVLKDDLYLTIMKYFSDKLQQQRHRD